MAELICQRCGSSNPVNSEYLVFCHSCGKRLKGTFTEWKKEHQDGSFSDYKEQLVRKSASGQSRKQSSNNAPFKKVIWAAAVLLIVGAGAWMFTKGPSLTGNGLRLTPGEMLNTPWKRYTCGRFGLSVELPGKLDKETVADEPDAETEKYVFHPSKGFQATLVSVKHRNKVTGLETLATEAVNAVMNQPGVSGVRYEVAPFQAGDIPGLLIRGALERDGVREIFYTALFVKSLNTWEVQLRHLYGDENGAEAVTRVLDSVEINYFGTPV